MPKVATVTEALSTKESISVEFKSDRKRLSDDDLIAAVVAMANAMGGRIFLGVEDDGTPTGLHPVHDPPEQLPALVANRTVPSVYVSVERLVERGHVIARVTVPQSRQIVATSAGGYYRRSIKHDGTPEDRPLLPHDISARRGQLGIQDATRHAVPGGSLDDFDATWSYVDSPATRRPGCCSASPTMAFSFRRARGAGAGTGPFGARRRESHDPTPKGRRTRVCRGSVCCARV
jgi:predicted HTH transcriptional regulator